MKMRNIVVASLALALVACSGNASQVKDDTTKTAEVGATSAQASAEATPDESAEQAAADAAADMEAALQAAATGEHRSEANIARNKYRHPVETLTFFGIEPDMTVVEIWPGGGWYTEVIAPVLVDGQLVAASFAPKTEDPEHYSNRIYKEYSARLENEPVFSNVRLGMLQPGQKVDIGEPESADMVVTFRNIHSFINADILDEILAESFKVLKPGGIFGVVQHRAKEGADVAETVKDGYVPTAYVIAQAEAAGFELVEKSEINANPKDTTDHPKGVWTLPPSYRLGDVDRAKYEAIGESDRMTLKFRKPVAAVDEAQAEQGERQAPADASTDAVPNAPAE
jgi:predicted methyltransferase